MTNLKTPPLFQTRITVLSLAVGLLAASCAQDGPPNIFVSLLTSDLIHGAAANNL